MREPIKVVADILQKEMELSDGQVMLAYEKFDIPKTEGIYIALSTMSIKPIGLTSTMENTVDGPVEVQQVLMRSLIQIDLMSFDSSARVRKEEVLMALGSIYSQQKQEENNLQVAHLSSEFIDAASLEETKFLNRFTTTIAVTSLNRKSKLVPYYDQFNQPEVTVNG